MENCEMRVESYQQGINQTTQRSGYLTGGTGAIIRNREWIKMDEKS